ncbi:MAG: hypothetical protein HOP19_02065 [Acidobacteria bacterium]|nr:hypothetical protein [Acidobacteriota bacterium]
MENTALATMQRSLDEAREAKRKIQTRLLEIDAEAATLRAQLSTFDFIIEQTEGAVRRMLFPAEAAGERPLPPTVTPPSMPTPPMTPDQNPFAHRLNAHFESAPLFQQSMQQAIGQQSNGYAPAHYQASGAASYVPSYPPPPGYANGFHNSELQPPDIEAAVAEITSKEKNGNVRFNDFRIPQAATIVLREAPGPLHVSEIYRRMAEGGFEFRGQHQLITLAVSLSRSKRFRKVAPGTFDLNPAYQQPAGQVA